MVQQTKEEAIARSRKGFEKQKLSYEQNKGSKSGEVYSIRNPTTGKIITSTNKGYIDSLAQSPEFQSYSVKDPITEKTYIGTKPFIEKKAEQLKQETIKKTQPYLQMIQAAQQRRQQQLLQQSPQQTMQRTDVETYDINLTEGLKQNAKGEYYKPIKPDSTSKQLLTVSNTIASLPEIQQQRVEKFYSDRGIPLTKQKVIEPEEGTLYIDGQPAGKVYRKPQKNIVDTYMNTIYKGEPIIDTWSEDKISKYQLSQPSTIYGNIAKASGVGLYFVPVIGTTILAASIPGNVQTVKSSESTKEQKAQAAMNIGLASSVLFFKGVGQYQKLKQEAGFPFYEAQLQTDVNKIKYLGTSKEGDKYFQTFTSGKVRKVDLFSSKVYDADIINTVRVNKAGWMSANDIVQEKYNFLSYGKSGLSEQKFLTGIDEKGSFFEPMKITDVKSGGTFVKVTQGKTIRTATNFITNTPAIGKEKGIFYIDDNKLIQGTSSGEIKKVINAKELNTGQLFYTNELVYKQPVEPSITMRITPPVDKAYKEKAFFIFDYDKSKKLQDFSWMTSTQPEVKPITNNENIFQFGNKNIKTQMINKPTGDELKTVQEFSSSIANINVPSSSMAKSQNVFLFTPSKSEYEGQGTYERTIQQSAFASISKPKEGQQQELKLNLLTEQQQRPDVIITNWGSGDGQREPTKTDVVPIQIITPIQTTEQRQRNRIGQPPTKNNFGFTPVRPGTTEAVRYPPIPLIFKDKEEDDSSKIFGFIPQVKTKSGFKTISGPVSFGEAIYLGSKKVDTTLARTFRVLPTQTLIKKPKKQEFKSPLYKFRTFKQSKGQRTNLSNTFIEKSKYSLEYPSETNLIQSARRSTNNKKSFKNFFGF